MRSHFVVALVFALGLGGNSGIRAPPVSGRSADPGGARLRSITHPGRDGGDVRPRQSPRPRLQRLRFVCGRGGTRRRGLRPLDRKCFPGQAGGNRCFGANGAISRLWNRVQEKIATGFPSHAGARRTECDRPERHRLRHTARARGLGSAQPARRPIAQQVAPTSPSACSSLQPFAISSSIDSVVRVFADFAKLARMNPAGALGLRRGSGRLRDGRRSGPDLPGPTQD